MKKVFLFLVGVLILAACEKEQHIFTEIENVSQFTALDRYLMRVAEEGITMLGYASTRTGAQRVVDPMCTRAFIKSTTRSEEDTLFYVVNFADNSGFALVKADSTSSTPLLAVAEQGNYTPGELTNTGFDDYIELLSQHLTRDIRKIPIDTTTLGRMYSELEEGPEMIVASLLDVEWGQHEPYNYHCYNNHDGSQGVAGCVPVAIAQILSHHEYPLTLTLTHPYADTLNTIMLDWNQIKTHAKTVENTTCSCPDDHFALRHLLRQIGQIAGTSYYLSIGATNPSNVVPTFETLGYSADGYFAYERNLVWNELDAARPVYCRGSEGEGVHGHAWVIDGYHYQMRIMRIYQEGVGNRLPTLIREEDWGYDLLHINWGWDGNCNGWYDAGVFTPSNGSYVFDYNIQILTNVKPIMQ